MKDSIVLHRLKFILYPKRALVCGILIFYIVANFWLTSRYPALDQKQIEGAMVEISGMQTMWPAYPVLPTDQFSTRVYKKTLNWIFANLQGMRFGLITGALFLTFFGLLQFPSASNRFFSSGLGLIFGAPLGVCVNCAAPLMRGLTATKNLAFALSAMISSPAFNIIVLTMLFTLFPLYIATIRVGAALVIILLFVPLLVPRHTPDTTYQSNHFLQIQESWLNALTGLTVSLAKNLAIFMLTSAPLMVLAGLLGVLLTELIDLQTSIEALPFWSALLIASFFGVFLPVPMAFDLVLAYSFFSAGAPMGVVVALLLGLGTYSVYSAIEVARAVNTKAALKLSAAVFAVCVVSGAVVESYHSYIQLPRALSASAPDQIRPPNSESQKYIHSWPQFKPVFSAARTEKSGNLTLSFSRLNSTTKRGGEIFQKRPITEIGLRNEESSLVIFAEPELGTARGISVADLNGDGLQDLIFGRSDGISIFLNHGAGFQEVKVEELEKIREPVLLAVAHDFDGDGLQDILVSTYSKGVEIFFQSRKGSKLFFQKIHLAGTSGVFATALALDDLNDDGLPDLFFGVSGSGQFFKRKISSENENLLFMSTKKRQWTPHILEGSPGETLAALFSDITGDGLRELIIANDFGLPSMVYKPIMKHPWLVPLDHKSLLSLPGSAMGIDTAYLRRTPRPDIYISASWANPSRRNWSASISYGPESCNLLESEQKAACEIRAQFSEMFTISAKRTADIRDCSKFTGLHRGECLKILKLWLATSERRKEHCEEFDASEVYHQICRHFFLPNSPANVWNKASPPMGRSELYQSKDDGWKAAGKKYGLDHTGWSWDAKFADFDLDGWPDLVIANGFLFNRSFHKNLFFRNYEGALLLENVPDFERTLMNSGFVKIDFDNDGDLDLIFTGTHETISFFENVSGAPRTSFELKRNGGSIYGAKLVFSFVKKGERRTLVEEIKFAPGYMSHDGPRISVAIPTGEILEGFEVIWPNGEKDIYNKIIQPGQHVRVIR